MKSSTSLRLLGLPVRLRWPVSDILLVAGVVLILSMLLLPLPPWLIDVLVGVNLATGVVMLLMALYVGSALEFSVFPNALLVSTLFRLALSIATTRQILLHGHAGRIIQAFGELGAGGNLVVGLVVFIIITAVQFIVLAKGAERVAEVKARFTLDAMPGEQLSIEAALRAMEIDQAEAQRRRARLQQYSALMGSLDGAMKFVKGDAVAGIVIVAVNLLAGLAVGMLQHGLDASSAMATYSILSIGEGMVAQLPALLSLMAAGLVVTQVESGEARRHLGETMGRQIAAKPDVLLTAASLCALLALVPGFPGAVFLALALLCGLFGALGLPAFRTRWDHWMRRANETVLRRPEPPVKEITIAVPQPPPPVPLLLEVPASALEGAARPALVRALDHELDAVALGLGLPLPALVVRAAESSPARWRLLEFELAIAEADWPAGDHPRAVADLVGRALRRQAPRFIGTQETGVMLLRAAAVMPEVVEGLKKMMFLPRLAEVLQRLVEEGVSVRHQRRLFEALLDAAQREKDVHVIAELARASLREQICHAAAPAGRLRAVTLSPGLENLLRKAVHVSQGRHHLALDGLSAQAVAGALTGAIARDRPDAVLAHSEIRRHVRKLIDLDCFDTPVIGLHELVPTLDIEVAGCVDLPAATDTETP